MWIVRGPVRLIVIVAALLVGDVSAKDLPYARAYRQILDVCIEQTLLNREAHSQLARAGRTMLVHCGCVADMAMAKIPATEIQTLLNGEIPVTAKAQWVEAHELCISAGF
jgi:hypothetical protein